MKISTDYKNANKNVEFLLKQSSINLSYFL